MMKNNCLLFLFLITISLPQISFAQNQSSEFKERKILETVTTILHDSHYDPAQIDNTFSKGVFNNLMTSLDPDKRIFLASDIEEFKKYETRIDDLISTHNLTFFNLVYERTVKRMKETKVIYTALLKKPNDYYTDETINPNDDGVTYAKSHSELKNRWRIQIKYFILESLAGDLDEFIGPENTKRASKEFIELEKNAREIFLTKMNASKDNIDILDRNYFFEKYMNAIVVQFDPHSLYMRNSKKNEAEVNLSGKLVGIGARLVIKDKFIAIGEMAYGGPASNTKQIDVGDILLKVTEGNTIPVNIVGLKLPEVVELMKGKIGTAVHLTLKKDDGRIKVISVKRDNIEYKDSYAKSCVVEKNGKKFGVIDLPKFYKDFDDENNRDSAIDVKGEVEFLKKEGVNGIVIDLRNNGGGAVDAAIDITGLFIEKGPIVQIKSANKTKEILSDTKSKMVWDGPLVVLLNNESASASEILAASIQDYKRGIVMGGKQSYGKGTVQKTTDLDLYYPKGNEGNYGALKTTIKKIYRINGNSTQLKGITSDVIMPDKFSYIEYGERDKENVITWDQIEAIPYKKCTHLNNYDYVVAASKKRIDESKYFYLIDKNAEFLSQKEKNTLVNLNVVQYKLEQDKYKRELFKFEAIHNYENHLNFKSTAGELKLIQKTPSLGVRRKEWQELLSKDIYIDEALNVLNDLKNSSFENKKATVKR